MSKSRDAFRTISEVAEWLGIQAHVLRFWESKFSQVKPVKRAGGRRYYRPADMQLLGGIKKLLHDDGLTIKGVQKILRENGVAHVSALSQGLDEMAHTVATDQETVVKFQAKPFLSSEVAQIDMDLGPEPAEDPDDSAVVVLTPQKPVVITPAAAPVADPEPSEPEPVAVAPIESSATVEITEEYVPGPLQRLSGNSVFSSATLAAMRPIANELKAWLDRQETSSTSS
ncbi:MerR family transcriptional regulator [Phaeobacter sp. NW0010-22]|uniref:MerR family transcriptional regulator n=1 Tax=Phaeobacter sp. NW0010-22 TaxID=3135907 RepID=UPI00310A2740